MAALDPCATIQPGVGLGGLALGTRVADIQDLLLGHRPWRSDRAQLMGWFEARYRLPDTGVSVCVDVRNGRVFKLIATAGYRGRLLGAIGVGMLVADALRACHELEYDEPEELLSIRGVPGVSLDVPERDPDPARVPSLVISAISVFLPEAMTPAGQRGEW